MVPILHSVLSINHGHVCKPIIVLEPFPRLIQNRQLLTQNRGLMKDHGHAVFPEYVPQESDFMLISDLIPGSESKSHESERSNWRLELGHDTRPIIGIYPPHLLTDMALESCNIHRIISTVATLVKAVRRVSSDFAGTHRWCVESSERRWYQLRSMYRLCNRWRLMLDVRSPLQAIHPRAHPLGCWSLGPVRDMLRWEHRHGPKQFTVDVLVHSQMRNCRCK